MTFESFLIQNSTTVNYADPKERYVPLSICLGLIRALERHGVDITIEEDLV